MWYSTNKLLSTNFYFIFSLVVGLNPIVFVLLKKTLRGDVPHLKGVFDLMEKKWKDRKIRISINELG
jgi:hypothetical protein